MYIHVYAKGFNSQIIYTYCTCTHKMYMFLCTYYVTRKLHKKVNNSTEQNSIGIDYRVIDNKYHDSNKSIVTLLCTM